jgi:hypothetical protein
MTARRPSANDRGPARAAAPYVLLGLVAFLARLLPTLRGGGLSGLGVYDDAVYYSGRGGAGGGGCRTPTSSCCTPGCRAGARAVRGAGPG